VRFEPYFASAPPTQSAFALRRFGGLTSHKWEVDCPKKNVTQHLMKVTAAMVTFRIGAGVCDLYMGGNSA